MKPIASLFDPRDYLRRLRRGGRENTKTHFLFDPTFYAEQVPQLAQPKEDLLEHFLQEGWREGFDPHPLFSIRIYLAARGSRPLTQNPMVEFVTDPACFDLDTHPLFSPSFYKAQYQDIAEAKVNPLLHYLSCGWTEGRRPHPLFDPTFYKAQQQDIAKAKINPLLHYLSYGSDEGRRPHPLFDPTFYRQQMLDFTNNKIEPLAHFLQAGWREGFDPHPLFSVQTYLAARGPCELPNNPLVEFVTDPARFDLDTHPLFSPSFYKAQYPDIAEAKVNPLLHYLSCGWTEGRRPNPKFDAPLYYEQATVSKLEHFLTHGIRVGMAPTWRALRDGIFYRLMCRTLRDGEVSQAVRQDRILMQVESLADILTVAGTVQPLLHAAKAAVRLRPAMPYLVPAVRILGLHSSWPEVSTTLPSQEVLRLDDVVAVGGSRLVVTTDGQVLHDELSLPDAEHYGLKLEFIRAHAGGRVLAHISLHKLTIQEGILLASDGDYNYFHWMIESLPKIELIEAANIPSNVPFLISDNVPDTGLEALRRLAGTRPIIRLQSWKGYRVERLHVPSDRSRVLNNYNLPVSGNDVAIDPKAVQFLRSRLLPIRHQLGWRKVFLERKSTSRVPHNQDQLISFLTHIGFEILDTGKMTLDEQINLWGEISVVIVPTGASLTNIIFAGATTRILILAPDDKQTNPYIFTQIGSNFGLEVAFLFCERAYKITDQHSVHDDYYVNCDLVIEWAQACPISAIEEECTR